MNYIGTFFNITCAKERVGYIKIIMKSPPFAIPLLKEQLLTMALILYNYYRMVLEIGTVLIIAGDF